MPKLTDTQLIILSTAAQRDRGAALPLPKSVKLEGSAVNHVLNSLLKKGLLAEKPAAHDAAAWRESKDSQRLTLAITDAGRQAMGIETDQAPNKQSAVAKASAGKRRTRAKRQAADSKSKRRPQRPAARSGTKQAVLIELLSRRDGATIDEAVKATGWQPHSVRGAISGSLKKKLGLAVTSEKVDGRGRVYRVAAKR
jgi:transposase